MGMIDCTLCVIFTILSTYSRFKGHSDYKMVVRINMENKDCQLVWLPKAPTDLLTRETCTDPHTHTHTHAHKHIHTHAH